jgi:copper(I)-binding protein
MIRTAAFGLLLLTTAAAMAAPSALRLEDPWIRALPGSLPAGGYFVLHNDGKSAQTLVSAQSDACGMLMLHVSENKGGMSAMHEVTGVDVAPGAKISFAPGGYHLMCMGAKPAIRPGAKVPVTLIFKSGEKLTADFDVRGAAGK